MVLQRAGSEVETTPTPSEQIRPHEEYLKTLDLLSLRPGESLEKLVDPSYAAVERVERVGQQSCFPVKLTTGLGQHGGVRESRVVSIRLT